MSAGATIEVRALRLQARIGVTDLELEVERDLVIDITIETADNLATETDSIEDTVDYASVARVARELATKEPHRTLERLAAKIAEAVATRFETECVEVRCAKPSPPMEDRVAEVAVRVRSR